MSAPTTPVGQLLAHLEASGAAISTTVGANTDDEPAWAVVVVRGIPETGEIMHAVRLVKECWDDDDVPLDSELRPQWAERAREAQEIERRASEDAQVIRCLVQSLVSVTTWANRGLCDAEEAVALMICLAQQDLDALPERHRP